MSLIALRTSSSQPKPIPRIIRGFSTSPFSFTTYWIITIPSMPNYSARFGKFIYEYHFEMPSFISGIVSTISTIFFLGSFDGGGGSCEPTSKGPTSVLPG